MHARIGQSSAMGSGRARRKCRAASRSVVSGVLNYEELAARVTRLAAPPWNCTWQPQRQAIDLVPLLVLAILNHQKRRQSRRRQRPVSTRHRLSLPLPQPLHRSDRPFRTNTSSPLLCVTGPSNSHTSALSLPRITSERLYSPITLLSHTYRLRNSSDACS